MTPTGQNPAYCEKASVRRDMNFWGFTISIILGTLAVLLIQIACDLKGIRQSLAPPAITDADRHSIGEKEPK